MSKIHSTAIVEDGATVASGAVIGPYCTIAKNVSIGAGTVLRSHVVVEGHTTIGEENTFSQFSSIGSRPQDLKYSGEPSELKIGDRNQIREYVTIQPGTEGGGMLTKIGSDNLFMISSHIGHDCIAGDKNIIANGCAVAGHVTIGDSVTLGGLCAVHQYVRLGNHSYIGGGSMVTKDVPHFCMAQGDRVGLSGINVIGLERAGWSLEEIAELKRAYRTIFLGDGLFRDRLERVKGEAKGSPVVLSLIEFIENSDRGIAFPRKITKAQKTE